MLFMSEAKTSVSRQLSRLRTVSGFFFSNSKKLKNYSFLILVALMGFVAVPVSQGAIRVTTAAGGNWNSTSTWAGGVIPINTDAAVILAGASVTVTANATVSSLVFSNNSSSTATFTVNSGVTLTVTGGITNQNSATTSAAALIQGSGSISCAALTVGGTATPTPANSDYTTALTSTITNLTISGNLTINAVYNSVQSAANQGTFALGSGAVNVGGSVAFTTVPLFGPSLTLAAGTQDGTLTLSGSTPFSFTGGGSYTFNPNGNSATVVYSGASQTVLSGTYQNLILSGSGTKTTTSVTVNGLLSRRGTATLSTAPTYGTWATLEYKGGSAQTTGPELVSLEPTIVIDNPAGVTMANSTTVSLELWLKNGILTTTSPYHITVSAGALVQGASASSYVSGNLQAIFTSGTQQFTFPIGDSSSYAPLTLSNLSVITGGTLTASTTAGNHPQLASSNLDPNRMVNRYWSLTNFGGTFGTYIATFNYSASDLDTNAIPDQFAVYRWNSNAWSGTTVIGTPTTNSTTITGQNGLGDFAIGNLITPAQMLSGSYTGNGTDNRTIAIGFQPDAVIIKSASANTAVIRSSTMSGDTSKEMTGATALLANRIQSFTNNGFLVGTDATVNGSGVTYYWIAFKASTSRMTVGTYLGNSASSHAITGVGFSPELVMFMSASNNNLVVQSADALLAYQLDANSGNSLVNSLDTNGFTLGSDARVNGNGITYHYIAWNQVAGVQTSGRYLGFGTNQTVTGLGFQPEFVLTKSASTYGAVQHSQAMGGSTDQSQFFTATANASNEIKALQTNGFQVGTAPEVNTPGVSNFYFAWKKIVLPSRLVITSVNGGASPNAGTAFSVIVQSQDASSNAAGVSMNTVVSLSLNTGGGILGGTLTGSIPVGSNTVTISGVTYSKAESGVILTASRMNGDALTSANSGSFTVNPGAFSGLQLLMPGETAAPGTASGKTGSPTTQIVGTSCTVTVNSVDANWNAISTNDTVAITSSDSNAILPANAALSGGTKTFNVTFKTSGSQTVTAADVTHSGIATNTGSATLVNPGNQTITFPSPGNQTYGVGPITLGATASSGLPVNYSVISGSATVSSNQLTITGSGSVTIQASQAGNANWNAAATTNQTISVAQKTVIGSITVNNKTYDAAVTATIATRSLSGVTNSDVVGLTGGTATFANKNVGNGKTIIATGLSLSGANAGNYVLASTSATNIANITTATLTVGATGISKTYDGTTNATVTLSDNRLAGDSLTTSYASASFADGNVGNNKTVSISGITVSGSDSGNYTANTSATTTANIIAATILVSANNASRPYGTANPAFTASYNGFVNGEGTNVISGSPVLSTAAATNSPVGTYPIQVSQGTLSSANYTFSLTNGTLTITSVAPVLTISFTNVGNQTNSISLSCAGLTPNNTYYMQASTDLAQWQQVATLQAASDGTITYTETNLVLYPARFYRLSGN